MAGAVMLLRYAGRAGLDCTVCVVVCGAFGSCAGCTCAAVVAAEVEVLLLLGSSKSGTARKASVNMVKARPGIL